MRIATPYWFEVYPDKAGRFRWRYVCYNGNIMADSAQGNGYATKGNCKRSVRKFLESIEKMRGTWRWPVIREVGK